MKKIFLILIIASLTATASCGGKSIEKQAPADSIAASIIGKPIRIGNLEVAQYDFPNQMNWLDAQKACASLGPGWRLPTKDELNALYQSYWQKSEINLEFKGVYPYWSSKEYDGPFRDAQQIIGGHQGLHLKEKLFSVRAVRTF